MKSFLMFSTLIFSFAVCAASPDGSGWTVTTRSCNGTAQAPTLNEGVEFGNGVIRHTSIKTATEKDYCEEARVYQRNIKTKTDMSGVYTETSLLVGKIKETVCYSKADGSVLSDTADSIPAGRQSMVMQSLGDDARVTIQYSAECPNGALQLGLKRKPADPE